MDSEAERLDGRCTKSARFQMIKSQSDIVINGKKRIKNEKSICDFSFRFTLLVGARNADHLIAPEEFKIVHELMKDSNSLAATFFETAYWTAIRLNELYGLSIDDIFIGS